MPRIVTWNVNGLTSLERRLPIHIPDKSQHIDIPDDSVATDSTLVYKDVQYYSAMQKCLIHPCVPTVLCFTLKQLFDTLSCDILCIQEHKLINKQELTPNIAHIDGYTSYWSFNRNSSRNRAYSGCVTYCKNSTVTVVSAEEGFTGLLSDKGSIYGCCTNLYQQYSINELRELDTEGRCVISNINNQFLLFNCYLPNASNDIRDDFKLRYYNALQCRMDELIANGYNIILCGDVNTAHKRIDHCDPDNKTGKKADAPVEPFEARRSRQWLTSILQPSGHFVDLFRLYHPNRLLAYTCWNTITNARLGNFGTRIDYFLVNEKLIDQQLFTYCDIWPDVAGSDHCPVACDINIELYNSNAQIIESSVSGTAILQSAGTQSSLKSYFTKPKSVLTETEVDALTKEQSITDVFDITENTSSNVSNGVTEQHNNTATTTKRIVTPSKSPPNKKSKTTVTNNQSLLSFFNKPTPPTPTKSATELSQRSTSDTSAPTPQISEQSDYVDNTDFSEYTPVDTAQQAEATKQWSKMFTKPALTLLCKGHELPCKMFKTNKNGNNKGREFYCCAIPPPDRCKTWMWKTNADTYIRHRINSATNPKGVVAST